MKYLHFNEIDITRYELIGFDMDGTLYEEQKFVEQAYKRVANYLSTESGEVIYNWMLQRWVEKGSSYPYIFSESIEKFQISGIEVSELLNIYRETLPQLKLQDNIVQLLNYIDVHKAFLITDGNPRLQRNKYQALGLDKYFLESNCGFTGDLGMQYYKPNIEILNHIQCFNENRKILYFGDRDIDEQFANAACIDFMLVKDFKKFWSELK